MNAAVLAEAGSDVVGPSGEFLSFRIGDEEYGIDILKVQEIRGYEHPTRMVNAPEHVKGVVNLRGVIVPIIDMRVKFGLAEPKYDDVTVTIILNIAGRVVGVVVDAVSDVIRLSAAEIRPAPDFQDAAHAGCILGIGTVADGDGERMLILMDIERLMCAGELGFAFA